MGFINLGRLNIRKRNSCASALVSLSDVPPPSVYKSHILNGPFNKLYIFSVFFNRQVCCNSNEYTQHTIINIKKKITQKYPIYNNVSSCEIILLGAQEQVRNNHAKRAIHV